jgi:phosphatidylglycerol:prolipoprotein diacylglycerol transferase
MFPRLFTIGDSVTLHTYGLMMASALLLGIYIASRYARRAGLDPGNVWNLGVYMALAGLVGSKLLLVLTVWNSESGNLREFFSLRTLFAGGVWYGGLALALTVCGLYAWRNGMNFAALGDAYSPGVAAGYALGRLGCFSAGCCWGKPTEVAWAVTFTDPYSARVVGVPLEVALHPTQLYSSAASALIFLLLVLLWRRRTFTGQIFAAYMMLYAVARFIIEFYRGDPRGEYFFNGALSQAQTICIPLFLVAGLFWLYQRRHSPVPVHAEAS